MHGDCDKYVLSNRERAYRRALLTLHEETNIVNIIIQLRQLKHAMDILLSDKQKSDISSRASKYFLSRQATMY